MPVVFIAISTAKAMTWHCHGVAMGLPWQCHGIDRGFAMALPRQCQGIALAIPWHCQGNCDGDGVVPKSHSKESFMQDFLSNEDILIRVKIS